MPLNIHLVTMRHCVWQKYAQVFWKYELRYIAECNAFTENKYPKVSRITMIMSIGSTDVNGSGRYLQLKHVFLSSWNALNGTLCVIW